MAWILAAALSILPSALGAEGFVDLESGVAFTGYNDVRIPSETGTTISLKTDIASAPAFALRARAGYTLGERHTFMVLLAPLSVYGSSTLDRPVSYQGTSFAQGSKVSSLYRFDSFRLTYRYAFIKNDGLVLAAGVTGKLRSADIALMDATAYAHRSDLGVVPLLHGMVEWSFARPFSLLAEADALVTPFGRAEDVLLALQYHPSDRSTFRLGYRLLEGGSDGGGKVYTFALFHYITAGLKVRL